ncbi:transcription antitermination factor NusB [Clostridium oryzae]|uniref:Transcription antitermination protein NusB n=1 Tax=Clostridium oryzae TaxID=1450648 RepID=A0A1V4IT68_9CLOT|nr:transcription antitermination factor NusB [Clostridium oryzae]OPJ63202.1 hypothetical protein CLORY_12850 [Clostridium oryzae]
MNRKITREETMKLLFEMSINKYSPEELIESYLEANSELDQGLDIEYMKRVLNGILEHKENIDNTIKANLHNWKLGRVSKINLAILRVSTYELLYEDNIPKAVSINEAVEMSKKYSDYKSVSFINGVLDKIEKRDSESK